MASDHIPTGMRREVEERANGVCEYCHLSQEGQEARFHIDHVIPRSAGGETKIENLALSCVSCSLRKAARLTWPDPDTGDKVTLYNPRTMKWDEHFVWRGSVLVGSTSIGRATISALNMNRPFILAIRDEEAAWGRHEPKSHGLL